MTGLRSQKAEISGARWNSAASCTARRIALLALLVAMALTPAAAQKNKNDQSKQQGAQSSGVALSDDEAIEKLISLMLAAWQTGDGEGLHAFYADDALFVSGVWEPPISGWAAYLRSYQAQRARTKSVRMDRTNTFRKVEGNSAWATYQWVMTGTMDGNPISARGQTSLVLEKRSGKWLIVLNHTSLSQEPAAAPAGGTGTR